MLSNKTVSHVIVNNLGGITSLITNLIRYGGADALPQELVLLNIANNVNASALISSMEGVEIKTYYLNPKHNWYHVYGQLAKLLSSRGGVLVSNDIYDLVMLSYYNIPRKVVQIVHDGYNVKLSIQFETVIDAFICHSHFFYEMLCQLLPQRRSDIFYIPYGIPLINANRVTRTQAGPLRLLFLGRHDVNKGVFDLYVIHQLLKQRNIPVDWLVLGKGPETERLKQQWEGEQVVRFFTPDTQEEVIKLASERDIFVFPTKFEGFPVALIETMSVGCVPIVSDLPGGIREIVMQGKTGFRCSMDNNEQFADRIAHLHFNRNELESMSSAAHDIVCSSYNAELQSPCYQELFNQVAAYAKSPLHHKVKDRLGSRLDQPWLPNLIVKYLRKASR